MTRIVAGQAKGRTLAVPAKGTRPTSERVREALFSRLDHMGLLDGTTVLDLYAGSGALGLEAASRGAAHVDLVERAKPAAQIIRANAKSTGLAATAHVHVADARAFLQSRTEYPTWDLVLVDPPYDLSEDDLSAVLAELTPRLTADALVVVERSKRSPEPAWPDGLVGEGVRKHGETVLWEAGPPAAEPDSPSN